MKKSGSSVIELSLLFIILGITFVIVTPKFEKFLNKIREASTKSALNDIREAIDLFKEETGVYPFELSNRPFKILIKGECMYFSFLPSLRHKGYVPSDPKDCRLLKYKAKLRMGLENNESNEVTLIKGPKDGRRTVYRVSSKGGWVYVADPDGAILRYKDTVVYLKYGDVTVLHKAYDSTGSIRYFQY